MSAGGGDSGLWLALINSAAVPATLTAVGTAFAWWCTRRDNRRKEREKATEEDEEELQEKRRFYDERAQAEIVRIEGEREAARAECREAHIRIGELQQDSFDARMNWLACFLEALRVRALVVQLHASPPPPGTPSPVFDPMPDPRRQPAVP